MNLDGNQDLRWPGSLLSWQKACHSSPSPSRVQQLSPSLLTLSEAHPGSYVNLGILILLSSLVTNKNTHPLAQRLHCWALPAQDAPAPY